MCQVTIPDDPFLMTDCGCPTRGFMYCNPTIPSRYLVTLIVTIFDFMGARASSLGTVRET